MFVLVVVGPFVMALDKTFGLPAAVKWQFGHHFHGFTFWDLIMPLFIFMCGAAVPFALGRRMDENGRPKPGYWRHVLSRFALLWFLGLVAQGQLLSLDPLMINPFNNTLQAIASGYLIAAVVLLVPSRRVQIAVPIALALAYAAALAVGNDYSRTGNVAIRFENWFTALITPKGSHAVDPCNRYTWWLSVPMFGAMTLCGSEAARILKSAVAPFMRLRRLAILGAVLLAVGWLVSPVIPVSKHISTLSFSAQAMGWCCLALAALYWLTDIRKIRRGMDLFVLFGQTALLAYMSIEVFGDVFAAFAAFVMRGVPHLLGPKAMPLACWLAQTVLLTVVLKYRHDHLIVTKERGSGELKA